MKCPACDNELTEILIDDIRVDVCKGNCGGIWFDWHELKKVDEPHESHGEALLNIEIDPSLTIDKSKKRTCPRCDEKIVMLKHFSSAKKEIEVDECGNCGGFWLDYGELNNLRNQFKTSEERDEYAKKYISEMFDPLLESERNKDDTPLDRASEMMQVFKFVCPSYYIPGKQSFGSY